MEPSEGPSISQSDIEKLSILSISRLQEILDKKKKEEKEKEKKTFQYKITEDIKNILYERLMKFMESHNLMRFVSEEQIKDLIGTKYVTIITEGDNSEKMVVKVLTETTTTPNRHRIPISRRNRMGEFDLDMCLMQMLEKNSGGNNEFEKDLSSILKGYDKIFNNITTTEAWEEKNSTPNHIAKYIRIEIQVRGDKVYDIVECKALKIPSVCGAEFLKSNEDRLRKKASVCGAKFLKSKEEPQNPLCESCRGNYVEKKSYVGCDFYISQKAQFYDENTYDFQIPCYHLLFVKNEDDNIVPVVVSLLCARQYLKIINDTNKCTTIIDIVNGTKDTIFLDNIVPPKDNHDKVTENTYDTKKRKIV